MAYCETVRLRRVESLKGTVQVCWIEPWTCILNRNRDGIRLGFCRLDEQFSRPFTDTAHCFNRVNDQVQDHLLQLDPICPNGRQRLRELRVKRDAVLSPLRASASLWLRTITSRIASFISKLSVWIGAEKQHE